MGKSGQHLPAEPSSNPTSGVGGQDGLGRLHTSEIVTSHGELLIEGVATGRAWIRIWFPRAGLIDLTPEEAYYLGGALLEHAAEAGFDPDG